MAPSPVSEILLIPARSIEAMLYLLIAVYIKNRGKQGDSSFSLNRIMFIAFFGGFVFSVFDNIIYLFAGLSFDPSSFVNAAGYDFTYPSLFWANIFRDIAMTGLILNIWALLIASTQIRFGLGKVKQQILRNKIILTVIFGISALIIVFDVIAVDISARGTFVHSLYSGVSSIFMVFCLIMYFIVATRFRQTSVGAFPSDHEREKFPVLFQRTKRMSAGILVTGFGYLNAVTWGILATIPEIYPFAVSIAILLNYITHGFWILALVLIFSALKAIKENPEK